MQMGPSALTDWGPSSRAASFTLIAARSHHRWFSRRISWLAGVWMIQRSLRRHIGFAIHLLHDYFHAPIRRYGAWSCGTTRCWSQDWRWAKRNSQNGAAEAAPHVPFKWVLAPRRRQVRQPLTEKLLLLIAMILGGATAATGIR